MDVQKRYKDWSLKLLLCVCLAIGISTCSNEHDHNFAENINSEFELTYRYVSKNMPIDIDFSDNLSDYRTSNKDAFTSIAYTWHSISVDACGLANNSNRKTNTPSYEQLIKQSPTDNNNYEQLTEGERICLAKIYFDHWSNINDMLLLSFSKNK